MGIKAYNKLVRDRMPNKAEPEAISIMRQMKELNGALQKPIDIEKVR